VFSLSLSNLEACFVDNQEMVWTNFIIDFQGVAPKVLRNVWSRVVQVKTYKSVF